MREIEVRRRELVSRGNYSPRQRGWAFLRRRPRRWWTRFWRQSRTVRRRRTHRQAAVPGRPEMARPLEGPFNAPSSTTLRFAEVAAQGNRVYLPPTN
ncbi:hypothetical protein QBC98_000827 [Kitasatospora acidiphila]